MSLLANLSPAFGWSTLIWIPGMTIYGIYALAASGVTGGLTLIPGIIFTVLGIACLSASFRLITLGVKALSRISQQERTVRQQRRFAQRERNRARWGMAISIGGVPVTR